MTYLAYFVTRLVKQFSWERSGTHTCAISLDDSEDLADLVRSDAKSHTCSSADGVGRSDKRITAEIHVEHSALSPFAQHRLAFLENVVYEMF